MVLAAAEGCSAMGLAAVGGGVMVSRTHQNSLVHWNAEWIQFPRGSLVVPSKMMSKDVVGEGRI